MFAYDYQSHTLILNYILFFKFGQRNNLNKIAYFKDPAPYFKMVFDPSIVVHSINIISEHMIAVTYNQHEDFVTVMGNTNPVIAAYTTAQARLKLYSYIEHLGNRILYFDTDSLIYISNLGSPGEYDIHTGWYLGDMTNELTSFGIDSYISEFVSGGPKNYAYRVYSSNDKKDYFVIKVRGITLSNVAIKKVNFYSLRRLVHYFVKNGCIDIINVISSRIERKKDGRKIVTKTMCKKFRVVYDKRVVDKYFYTYPYGYRKD